MPDFHKYLMRHGEHGIQSIVELIERAEGIHSNENKTLEERWEALKREPAPQSHSSTP